ncbi:MAG: response regulator [Clostridiales bacterium]|nr:response regulator [Clostridiales bacterium]
MVKYQVLIADDEPTAGILIQKILERKCPDFQVVSIEENGQRVLDMMSKTPVDVVITDVIMPAMDGITLAARMKEEYPDTYVVIASGYQEFDYAKGAIQASVEDYLLKPMNPREVQTLFERIRKKLEKKYDFQRNQVLHSISNGTDAGVREKLPRLFPAEYYYAAVIRRNSVISRFGSGGSGEIFAAESEQLIIYGRDNMEMLYLCSEEMLVVDFEAMMDREFEKLRSEEDFLTMVICEERFALADLPEIVHDLYRKLDNSIVIGLEQKIFLNRPGKETFDRTRSEESFHRLLALTERRELSGMKKELEKLFLAWEEERCSQFWIEGKLRYFFYEMQNWGLLKDWNEYWLGDAFSQALTMSDLCSNILDILRQYADFEVAADRDDREAVFKKIVSYMKTHLGENLSVKVVCSEIGVSQATLSRLFHTYADTSYKNYLMNLRVEAAKRSFREHPESYIKDVAAYVGFSDQFYFSRVFRSVTGVSPSEYLEQMEREAEKEEKL